MIEVKSLYKSFEGKDVLVDINAISITENQSDYRSEWFGKNSIDEMYRGAADTRKGRNPL